MNLLDKKLGLLLVAALTLFACEEELSTINLGPENNLGIFFVETSLTDQVSQVWAGSAPSSFNGQLLVGYYQDPEFGDIRSTAFCDISVGQASYSIATINTAEFLSLDFDLRISSATGDFTSNNAQILELYRLSQPVDVTNTFDSSLDLPLEEKIGEAEFILHKDSIDYVYTGTGTPGTSYDASKRYIYKTKFTLTDSYKTSFLGGFKNAIQRGVAVDSADIDSVSYYLDQNLKGVAIVGRDQNNSIIRYNMQDITSRFKLIYTTENSSGIRDSATALFNINPSKSFSKIEPNEITPWTNSVFTANLPEINKTFKTSDENAYFQSGSNMFITLDLSEFKNFKDTLSNVIIQRAVLVIDKLISPQSNIKTPPSIGVFVSSNDSIANGNFNGGTLSESPNNGIYDADSNYYSIEIPLYLQTLIDNKATLDQIVLGVSKFVRDNSVNRFIVKKEDIKIRYYYSIPDKN
jgi:hypothetical protein